MRVLVRIALLPVIAGISYEVLKLAGPREYGFPSYISPAASKFSDSYALQSNTASTARIDIEEIRGAGADISEEALAVAEENANFSERRRSS